MSQAQTTPIKPAGSLGAQAAAAATTTTPATPGVSASTTSTVTPGAAAAATPGTEAPAGKKSKNPSKLYIVTGEVHEFETAAKAEKFLNAEGAPTAYSVLRGKQLKTNKKVSLR